MALLKGALSLLQTNKMRMMHAFEQYGRLVAARPWEMIIGTMTLAVTLLSMGLVTVNDWGSRMRVQAHMYQVSVELDNIGIRVPMDVLK